MDFNENQNAKYFSILLFTNSSHISADLLLIQLGISVQYCVQ